MRYLNGNNAHSDGLIERKEAKEINKELVDIGNRITELENEVHADEQALQDYKGETSITKQQGNFDAVYTDEATTGTLNANTGSIGAVNAKTVSATDRITTKDETVTGKATVNEAEIKSLKAAEANVASLNAPSAEVTNLAASKVDADTGKFNTLAIDTATIQTFNIKDANVNNDLTVGNKVTATEAQLTALVSDKATMNLIDSDAALLEKMQTHNIIYDDTLKLPYYVPIEPGTFPTGDIYRVLEVPFFDTGDYYLCLKDPATDICWWSAIVHNNHSNITVSYSRRTTDKDGNELTVPTLDEMYIYDYFSQGPKLYLKTFVGGNLYWQNQSLNEERPPAVYNDYPFDVSRYGALQYKCLHEGATWFSKHIDIIRNQSADNASLFLIPTDWNNANRETVEYNGLIDIPWHFYTPNQPVNTTDEVTFRNVIINPLDGKWVYNIENALQGKNPELMGTDGQLDPADNLIETEELAKWKGKVGIAKSNITQVAGTIFREQGYTQTSTNVYERRNPDSYNTVAWVTKNTRNDVIAVRRKSDWAIIKSSPYIIGKYEDEEQITWTSYRYVFYDINPDGQCFEEWIERQLPDSTYTHKLLQTTVSADDYINYTRFKEDFDDGTIAYDVYSYGNYSNPLVHLGDVIEGRWDAGDVHVTKKAHILNSSEPDYNGTLTVDGKTNLRDNVLVQDLNDPDNPDNVAQVKIYSDSTALTGGDLSLALNDETAEVTNANIVYGKSGLGPAEGGLTLTTNNDSTLTFKGDTNIVVGENPLSSLNHTGKLTITYSDIEFVGHKSTSTVPPEEAKNDPHVLFRDDVEIGQPLDRHNLIVHGKIISDAVVFSGNEGDNMRIRNLGTAADPDMNAVAEPCADVVNGKLISADSLITADKAGLYNGTVANNYTSPSYNPSVDDTYPIIHLGDNTTVHGDIHVKETAQIDGNTTIGIPAADSKPAVPANLEVVGNATVDTNLVVEGTSGLKGDVTVGVPASGADPAVPADLHVTGKTQHDDDVTLGDANNKVDLYVNGDIYQHGSSYETHAEQVFTTKDHIIMRDGAVSGLITGEHAGLQVMNYDGNNTQFHLCISRDGYGRVGDTDANGGSITETYSYQFSDYHLYKDGDHLSPTYEHYFDDKKLKIEHNFYIPTGATNVTYTETAELDEDDKPTGLYTVTMKYDLTGASLQKILTVEEAPQDQSLLYWDNTSKCSRTLIKPATIDDDKALVPVYNGSHIEYRKYISGNGDTGNGSVFVGTTAEFQAALLIPEGEEGYLPNNAVIILTDADNTYLHGEDQVLTPGP